MFGDAGKKPLYSLSYISNRFNYLLNSRMRR